MPSDFLAGVEVRQMKASDLAFAERLRAAAGWNQTRQDWLRFLALEPEGCFVASLNGEPAGTTTTHFYGPELSWIGMVLVAPECRRCGVGSALLRRALHYLEGRGAKCIKLDATPLGQPLYERAGFQPEMSLARHELTAAPSKPARGITSASPLRDTELARITELDGKAFGIERAQLLGHLARQSLRVLWHDGGEGNHSGFGMLRAGMRAAYLGPVIARSREGALPILQTLLAEAGGEAVFWDVPEVNPAAVELAQSRGFTVQRRLIRMFRGAPGPRADWSTVYAIVDPALG